MNYGYTILVIRLNFFTIVKIMDLIRYYVVHFMIMVFLMMDILLINSVIVYLNQQIKNGYLWRNDLAAINICRGREHGIANYNAYREYCGFKKAYYFEDFGNTINYDGIQLLSKLYKDPEDVDLFVALLLEDKLRTALVGPTTACLLVKQFQDLSVGDRFSVANINQYTTASFYNTGVTALRFLLCKTVDINQIPNYPFTPPDGITNTLINCSNFNQDTEQLFTTGDIFSNDGSATDGPSLTDLIGAYLASTPPTTNPDSLFLSN